MQQQLAEVDAPAFELTLVDIDSDPELIEKYNDLVPVLVGDAGEICHYFLDLVALRRYLRQT